MLVVFTTDLMDIASVMLSVIQ